MPVTQSVLILGYGATGKAVEKFLTQKGHRCTVIADTKKSGSMDWKQYAYVIKSPGVPLHDPLVSAAYDHNVPVLSDLALFDNPQQASVIGVTGTNGKSTVCAMIDHMLEIAKRSHALGGNFGTPVVALPELPKEGCYVLELSSYQLETMSHSKDDIHFDIGIVLNLDEDHLEHHLTMETYAEVKENLLPLSKQKIIVINDPWTQAMAKRHECITLSMIPDKNYWLKGRCLFKGNVFEAEMPIHTGPHDVSNAAVTWIVGQILEIESELILESLSTFEPLPHRQTVVRTIGKVQFINDSKATNIHAVIPSLQRFAGRPIHLILGGVPKFENLNNLTPHMKDVVCVYGIGQASPLIEKCLKDIVPFNACGDMSKVIKLIHKNLKYSEPAVVLLAPACASFDQYQSYADRGEHFSELVEKLSEKKKIWSKASSLF